MNTDLNTDLNRIRLLPADPVALPAASGRLARWALRIALLALVFLCWPTLFAPCWGQAIDAYLARILPTGSEQHSIDRGVLLVQDGKIIGLGHSEEIDIPANATLHDLRGMTLVPGMVIAQTGLIDQRAIDFTLTPQVQAIQGYDFMADRTRLLAAGITTVQLSPSGNRLLPGVTAVVKLNSNEVENSEADLLVMGQESLRIVLDSSSRNAPTIFEPPIGAVSVERPLEPSRPQVSTTLSSSLAALRAIFKNANSDLTFTTDADDAVVPHVAQFLSQSRVIRVSAETEPEIRAALSLAHEFELELILVDPTSPRLLEILAQHQKEERLPKIRGFVFSTSAPGSLGSLSTESQLREQTRKKVIRQLADDGWNVTFHATNDNDLRDILFAMAEFAGLTDRSHLSQSSAEILGLAHRVGVLETGKDADFAVLPSTPNLTHPLPLQTFVNGKKVFDRTPQSITTIIRAGQVYLGDGHVLSDQSLVIKGQTIRGVGDSVSAPLDAVIHDFSDGVVVPGYIDLGASLGTGAAISGNIALNTDLAEQLYPDDPAIKLARQQGVTVALIGSMNANQPTPLMAVKLGEQPRVIKSPAAIRFTIGDNPVTAKTTLKATLTRGKQYAGSWIKYDKDLAEYEAKKAEAAEKETDGQAGESKPSDEQPAGEKSESPAANPTPPAGGATSTGRRTGGGRIPVDRRPDGDKPVDTPAQDEKKDSSESADNPAEVKEAEVKSIEPKLEPPKKPTLRPELEPYRDLFAGKIPAFVEANAADAIEVAVKLFREDFDIRTVLCGAEGLARFPDLLNNHQVTVAAGPGLVLDLATPQQPNRRVNLAEVLANQGLVFGLQSKSSTGVGRLPALVKFSINQGLGVNDGLRALTQGAAQIIGQEIGITGRIQTGSDADLVVLSGPPFDPASEILAVMIDGNWVYFREELK